MTCDAYLGLPLGEGRAGWYQSQRPAWLCHSQVARSALYVFRTPAGGHGPGGQEVAGGPARLKTQAEWHLSFQS